MLIGMGTEFILNAVYSVDNLNSPYFKLNVSLHYALTNHGLLSKRAPLRNKPKAN